MQMSTSSNDDSSLSSKNASSSNGGETGGTTDEMPFALKNPSPLTDSRNKSGLQSKSSSENDETKQEMIYMKDNDEVLRL